MEPNLDNAVLSGNSDPRAVMKGITHGACDYLLKPIRIEELKNIWQHVVRRKIDSKDQNNMAHGDDGENHNCETGSNVGGPADPTEKVSKKRKDQSEEEDDECEENGRGNEDISTQKKPRVVWTVELHRKFVGAVSQLGIDKAVPKRILDIMNVDRLTRENVASHLQKYRLYLKRISNVASQQANIAAALGSKDLSYLHMGSLDVFGGFNSMVGSGHLSKTGLGSFHGAGTNDRLNSTSSLALRGLTSSGMIQLGLNNSGNSITDLGKMQQASFSGHQPHNVLQGMPHSLELDQLQQNKSVSHLGESSTIEDSRAFPVVQQQLTGLGGFPGSGVAASLCHSSFVSTSNSSLLQGHQQQALCGSTGNQSSVRMGTLSPEPFDLHAGASSHLRDRVSCNDSWQSTTQLPGYSSNSFPIVSPCGHGDLSSNNLRVSLQSMDTHARINPQSNAATSVTTVPLHDSISGGNPNCLPSSVDFSVGPLGVIGGNSKFSNFECMASSVAPSINYGQKLKLEDHKLDYVNNQTFLFNSPLNSLIPDHGLIEPVGQNLRQDGGICNQSMYMTSIGQAVSTSSFNIQNGEIGKPTSENSINLKEDYFSENEKLHGGFNSNNCGPYDDLMSPIPIIKREREEVALIDGDIGGYDTFPLGICM